MIPSPTEMVKMSQGGWNVNLPGLGNIAVTPAAHVPQTALQRAGSILTSKIAPGAMLVGGLAAAMGIYKGISSIPSIYRRSQSKKAVMEDPEIAKSQRDLAGRYFEILDTYAPSMAENPMVSKAFVKNLLQYEQIDVGPKLVADLISAETAKFKGEAPMLDTLKSVSGLLAGMSGND